eukprot:CAMPEP_0175045704 /NCGR_PEP_ID=MMETSP0052_2-20121109/4595_1 /TAXON_ID=51329 ORGANISM="Polytomella parva, Strain SAG 63-3" /NCGR_SAMPLE_ID=MMETSP0052_2 /ASSEMBLY_ACC=CAM_ASM_000194 /LENGTH=59 /DNA_ID=CAMNT_0016309313 /DNA_START=56 /DNA_END=235 /DNA_ORIENTATION=-
MSKLYDLIYNTFLKRTIVYYPTILVGAYYTDKVIDCSIDSFWKNNNKGKSYEEMLQRLA